MAQSGIVISPIRYPRSFVDRLADDLRAVLAQVRRDLVDVGRPNHEVDYSAGACYLVKL